MSSRRFFSPLKGKWFEYVKENILSCKKNNIEVFCFCVSLFV